MKISILYFSKEHIEYISLCQQLSEKLNVTIQSLYNQMSSVCKYI